MKTLYPINLKTLVLTLMLFAGVLTSNASHLAGGYITYSHLGGLRYRVTLTLYKDCSGINLQSETININDGICGLNTTLGASSQPTKRDTMLLFSSNYNPRFKCSGSSDLSFPDRPTNYEIVTYSAVIVLPWRSRNWVFWWTNAARPDVANLNSGSSGNVYLQTTLNNLDFSENNSSFLFNRNEGAVNATVNMPYFASSNTIDSDGDSLSYRLVAPMSNCSTRSNYNSIQSFSFVDSSNGVRRNFNTGSVTYSHWFPLASFLPINNQTGNARPLFELNGQYGTYYFWPRLYTRVNSVYHPDNKYIVGVEVLEHRRDTNGVMRVIGSSIREFTIQVNNLPNPTSPPILNLPRIKSDHPGISFSRVDSTLFVLEVPQRARHTYKLKFSNPTNTNLLVRTLAVNNPNITLNVVGQNTPNAYLELFCDSYQPVQEITVPVVVYDDKYPVRNTASFMLRVKVVPRTVVVNLQASAANLTFCEGDSIQISAPQGFNVVSWSNNAQGNSQWIKQPDTYKAMVTSDGTGLVESQSITVSQTQLPRPVLAMTGTQLDVNAESNTLYQWYRDGQLITGATSSTLNLSSDGVYHVLANRNGCTSRSEQITVTYFSILNRAVGMYPSPANDNVTLTAPKAVWDDVQSVQVMDALGRSVLKVKPVPNATNEAIIDIRGLANGQYRLIWNGTAIKQTLVVER